MINSPLNSDRQTFNNSYVYREFSKEVKGSWWYGVELPAWLRAFDCRATDAEIAPKSPWGTSLWGSERAEVDLGLRSDGVYNATTPMSCSTYTDARRANDADLSKQVADMVKAATELYTEYQAAEHKPGNGGSCLYCPVAIVMSNYGWSVVSDQRQCKIRPFSR